MNALSKLLKRLAFGTLIILTASVAHAQFDEIQNYGDGRTDGGGPGTWSPLAPDGATITAGGGDFWGGSDNASFVTNSDGSLTTTADFTATARHISTPDASTNPWGREPLMMRAQAASGAVLDPANPSNQFANSAHYMAFRRSASDAAGGWRQDPGGGTGGGAFQPTGNIRDTPHFLAIGRSGADLYAGHAADVSFGIGPAIPGRWIGLHSGTHNTIGAGTEVTVGVGHQSHNAIPGGGGAANATSWDTFDLNDGVFDPNLFGSPPAGDYTVFGGLDSVDRLGKVFGSAGTFENGAATGEPTGWKITAQNFDLVAGANANGSTVLPDVWWTHPGGGPPNGYPNDTGGADDNGGANTTNLFAVAVPGQFGGNQGNYGVDMHAEIFIPSDADRGGREWVAFKDGIDDFTYLQIDGQELINDNSWTGVESNQNAGGFVSRLDTSDAKYDDGEWVQFRMIMWEGGGGDTAALYWDTDGTGTFNFDAGNTPLTGVANGSNDNGAVGDRAADLVPAANFRQPGTTDPGIQADIYLAGNPGNLPAILNIVAPGRVVTDSYVVTGTIPVGDIPPNGIRAEIQQAIDSGDPNLNANTHPDTQIQEGDTPNPGQNDNYRLAARGTFIVDNANGTPDETIDLTFTIRNDDGGQLHIIGQSFTGVAGDGRTFIEDIGGDGALTADFFTGNTNALGHISLVEGTYQFDSYMFEGGGGSRHEIQVALGTKTAHDGDFFVIDGGTSPVQLSGPLDVYKLNGATGADPGGGEGASPSRFSGIGGSGNPVGQFAGICLPPGDWDEVSLMVVNTGGSASGMLTNVSVAGQQIEIFDGGGGIIANTTASAPPGLLAYFNFDGQSDNQSGPAPNAALNGPATIAAGGSGYSGGASDGSLDLGGVGNGAAAVVPAGSHFDSAFNNNAMAVSVWQYNTGIGNTSTFWVHSPAAGANERGFQAHIPWGNGTVFFDQSGCCNGAQRLTVGGAVNVDTWQHFVFQRDAAGNREIWVDGILAANAGGAQALDAFNGLLTIGAEGNNLNNSLSGRVDELSVWDRSLSPAEVGNLASGGGALSSPAIDFGITAPGNPVIRDFTLVNPSSDCELQITGLTLPAGYSVVGGAPPLPITLPADGTLPAQLQLNGDAGPLFQGGTVIVDTSSLDGPYTFDVTGVVDGVAPVIDCANDVVANVPPGGTATVSFAHITATDNVDGPIPVNFSPDDSNPFPVGVTVISCDATDTAGNTTALNFNVIVLELQASEALRSLVDVSLQGDTPPGPAAGTVGGIPAGATMRAFNNAYLNDAGELVFQANLHNAGANNYAVFSNAGGTLQSIGVRGQASPSGATYARFKNLALANDGISSFGALTDAGESHVTDSGSATTLQVGSPPPGLAGAPVVRSLTQAALDGGGDLYSQAGLRLGTGGAPAGEYIQDFEGFADGTTDLGDGSQMNGTASVQGGQLRLTTDGVAGGFASFIIPALPNSSLGFTATFDLEIIDGQGANVPADGMSFNYGNFGLGELGSAEEGMAGAGGVSENISFEIDTWMNFDAEQGVNIAEKVGGADQNLAFTNGPILDDGTAVSGTVTMSWDPVNGASFSTTGLLTDANFTNVATTFAASDTFRFGFSGRVGGANETKLIDNLRIVTNGPTTGAVTAFNDTLIWSAVSGLVAREGDQAAGQAAGVEYGHIFDRVVAADGPMIAFSGNLIGPGSTNAALWSGDPSALAVVAQKGGTAPGTGGQTFAKFNSESISPSGSVVFRAGLTLAAGAVDSSNNQALFTNRSGSLELIAREGDLAPCGAADVEFDRFTSLFIDSDGAVVFGAFLKGPSVISSNDSSVWRSLPDGRLSLVAREGNAANSVDGGVYAQLGVVATNDIGGVLIDARLVPGIGDVTIANRYGFWRAQDLDTGAPELILRRDDEVAQGEMSHKILSLNSGYVANGYGGTGGYGRVLNDDGTVVVTLNLSGGTSGVFTIPSN